MVKGPRSDTDWTSLRSRLAALSSGASQDDTAVAERDALVLRDRARRLARPAVAESQEVLTDIATFDLVGERYGIEASFVIEVLALKALTRLPRSPGFLLGLANVRGMALPIYDLRPLLGITVPGLSDLTRVVVLGRHEPDLGVLADAVREVASIPLDRLCDTPQRGTAPNPYIRGIFDHRLIVLDGARLLDDEELHVGFRA